MARLKRAIPIALFFVALSAINIFGASNLILTGSSTSGSPGVTYKVYTDVTRTGEKTAEVKYTIKSTPNGTDNCTGITAYLSVGSNRKGITIKSASSTWNGGSTYTSSGSYTITVKPKDDNLKTAFEVSGSGSYVTSYTIATPYTYYTYSYRDTGYYQPHWKGTYDVGYSGTKHEYKYHYADTKSEATSWFKTNRTSGTTLVDVTNVGSKFVKTGTESYVTGGPYTGYNYSTGYDTHYTYTGTMAKKSGYDVEIDKWYYVTYDANGGVGAPAKTGKIGKE